MDDTPLEVTTPESLAESPCLQLHDFYSMSPLPDTHIFTTNNMKSPQWPLNLLPNELPIDDSSSWNPVPPFIQDYVERIPTDSWAELLSFTSESTIAPSSLTVSQAAPLTVGATCTVKPGHFEISGIVAMESSNVLPLLVSLLFDSDTLIHDYFRRSMALYVQRAREITL
jgi:hypothetical protein